MFRIRCLFILPALLLVIFLAGCDLSASRTFEGETFSFTIPENWQTMEEIWNRDESFAGDYYGLGVQELVMIQYPAIQGQGKAFFAVASSPLQEGQSLESRFDQAYQGVTPEIRDAEEQPFEQGEWVGYQITYERPWGEPWWKFRDIWLEKDGMVYVLSFHASPNSFDNYTETFEQILESFQFKD